MGATGQQQEQTRPLQLDMRFDGTTYSPSQDGARMLGELKKVFEYMRGGEWVTLAELESNIGYTSASLSARIRDLRKARFGCHVVVSRPRMINNRFTGQWEYRLVK
jgi:hypothetical protein